MTQQNDQIKEIPVTFNMKSDLHTLFCRYANGFELTPEAMLEIMVDIWLRDELQYFNPPPTNEQPFTRKDLKP